MKTEEQSTAVEQLFNIWLNREYITEDEWLEAIEMEKEQIKDAWENGCGYVQENSQQYYNETFKQQEK
jgi:hypothetical protein